MSAALGGLGLRFIRGGLRTLDALDLTEPKSEAGDLCGEALGVVKPSLKEASSSLDSKTDELFSSKDWVVWCNDSASSWRMAE